MIYHDLPMKHGDFPVIFHDFPRKKGDLPRVPHYPGDPQPVRGRLKVPSNPRAVLMPNGLARRPGAANVADRSLVHHG